MNDKLLVHGLREQLSKLKEENLLLKVELERKRDVKYCIKCLTKF